MLDQILERHEPFPAWVIGRGMRFLAANRGAEALFPGLTDMSPRQLFDLWSGVSAPFAQLVENWPSVLRAALGTLRREALLTGDDELLSLLARADVVARTAPNGGEAVSRSIVEGEDDDSPVTCPVLLLDGRLVRTITTVMRFDTAWEVTTSELRIELLFPADGESDAALRRYLAARTASGRRPTASLTAGAGPARPDGPGPPVL